MNNHQKSNQKEIHEAFIMALDDSVISYSDLARKPLEVDLKPPLPCRIRLYLYRVTHPPGGREVGEHKIQLIVPGQERGQRGSFDYTGERIVLLGGYESDLGIFILWDADLYTEFSYSRNVQVKADTVFAALAGKIGMQRRCIQGKGVETVVTARSNRLKSALLHRMDLTRKRLTER